MQQMPTSSSSEAIFSQMSDIDVVENSINQWQPRSPPVPSTLDDMDAQKVVDAITRPLKEVPIFKETSVVFEHADGKSVHRVNTLVMEGGASNEDDLYLSRKSDADARKFRNSTIQTEVTEL